MMMLGRSVNRSMKSLTEGQIISEDEDKALKSDFYDHNDGYNDIDDDDSDSGNSSSSRGATTTATFTTTTVTTTTKTRNVKQKFKRLRSNKKHLNNINNSMNEMETTEMTEMTAMTEATTQQIQIREISEITATEMRDMTHTDITKIREYAEDSINEEITKNGNIKRAPVVITTGDEIKCCNTIDIYTGLYIIFSYNVFIAVLLIVMIIWAFVFTEYPSYFIAIWSLLFLIIRVCISIIGFLLIPKMTGLHGNELIYLKEKKKKYIKIV
eukprot:302849_1